MYVDIIKSFKPDPFTLIKKGDLYKVRPVYTTPLSEDTPFEVIEGPRTGMLIPSENCREAIPEIRYTEKEFNAVKKVLMDELKEEIDKRKRAEELVGGLTKAINKKNNEIRSLKYFVEVVTLALDAAAKAIEQLRSPDRKTG